MAQYSPGTVGVVVALLVGSVVGAGVALSTVGPPGVEPTGETASDPADSRTGDRADVAQFENDDAFRAYVAAGQRRQSASVGGVATSGGDNARLRVTAEQTAVMADAASGGGDGGGGDTAPERIAETNVQVDSLDEPDIVKTDGRHFYYAPETSRHYVEPRPDATRDGRIDRDAPPEKPRQQRTHLIDASDPDAPAVVAHINTTGQLLQTGDDLVVFERDRIAGYDVSDPSNPTEAWSHPLNGSVVTARERNGTVYVVTELSVDYGSPCPVSPLGGGTEIACTDVYRPGVQISADATYTALSLDADDGAVSETVTLVGTADNTAVYMSPDALYVTYTTSTDRTQLLGTFLSEEFDRTPDRVVERIEEIRSYDISDASKGREIRRAVDRWLQSVPEDDRWAVEAQLESGFDDYVAANQRNLTQTGIVRVDVTDAGLDVAATGTVPGEPLNQFSLDQHEGTLRVATTIPGIGTVDSANDLYTLDAASLDRRGAVTGMGETERIYAVRYVDDTAYVVTFRRIDPFHVVDLSDPTDPSEVGELELPGYSSYLHPIDETHVLGVGEENGRVKTVLFDVSDPSNPTIDDSEVLDNRYSSVAETHHAFLIDRRHGVFVLPAGRESVVMSYTDGELAVEGTVETERPATRTRYVDDSLYVFAGDSVAVVDETTWQTVTTLDVTQ